MTTFRKSGFLGIGIGIGIGRASFIVAVLACFALLYLAARQLAVDVRIAGVDEALLRNIAHFGVYGLLASLLAKACCNRYRLAWFVSLLLATGEEVHQLFVPGRYFGVDDLLLNFSGITTFILLTYLLSPIISRKFRGLTNPTKQNAVAS